MNEAAIVTLAIGEQHFSFWQRFCEPSWRAYAQKHQYDLFVVTDPFDNSSRAKSRSPAWQKCLVLSQEFAARYRQIISLDCDIVINADAAPRITDQTPSELVGGVASGSHVHPDLLAVLMHRLKGGLQEYQRAPEPWQSFQKEAYEHYGLSPSFGAIVQTGVLVASPQRHRAVFESVYATDYAYSSRCYEQIPLSHALLNGGLFRQIDTRFNCVFYESMLVHYPYLSIKELPNYDFAAECAVQTEYANNFFLHFAYEPKFASFLPPVGQASAPP